MDLNFYSDLTDGTGQHDDDPEFLDPQSFNGFDSDNKVTVQHFTHMGLRSKNTILFVHTDTTEAARKSISPLPSLCFAHLL